MFLRVMGVIRIAHLGQILIAEMLHVLLMISAIQQTTGGATMAGGQESITVALAYAEWRITTAQALLVKITAVIKKTGNGVKEVCGKAEHFCSTALNAARKTVAARYVRTMFAIQATKNGATAENGL